MVSVNRIKRRQPSATCEICQRPAGPSVKVVRAYVPGGSPDQQMLVCMDCLALGILIHALHEHIEREQQAPQAFRFN